MVNPKKKAKKDATGTVVLDKKEDRWFIDIYTLKYAATNRAARKKSKGKSRKKGRIVRSTSFLKSVVAQPGMISAYKDGKMGMSPKTHIFKMRKEEIGSY